MMWYVACEIGFNTKVDPWTGPAFFIVKSMTDTVQLQNAALPIVKRHGCDLVTLTFIREKPGWVLRLMVEKSGSDPAVGSGVDLQLCSSISRELGELIETQNLIDKAFVLEVSSPGIERPLTCEADFVRFANRVAKIKTRQAVDGKKKFQGKLLGADSSMVRVELNGGKKVVEIPHDLIAKANLVFDPSMLKTKSGEK